MAPRRLNALVLLNGVLLDVGARTTVFLVFDDDGNHSQTHNGRPINYTQARTRLVESVERYAPSYEVRTFRRSNIDDEFSSRPENRKIFAATTGGGFFLWKPYIIVRTLESLLDGDVVFYCDTKYWFVGDPSCLIDTPLLHDDFAIWTNKPNEIHTFLYRTMKPTVQVKYNFTELVRQTLTIWAGSLAIRKSARSMQVVQYWLDICQNFDDISGHLSENAPWHFQGHKYDQPLLSIALNRYKVNYTYPSTFLSSVVMQNERYPWKNTYIKCDDPVRACLQTQLGRTVPCNESKWRASEAQCGPRQRGTNMCTSGSWVGPLQAEQHLGAEPYIIPNAVRASDPTHGLSRRSARRPPRDGAQIAA